MNSDKINKESVNLSSPLGDRGFIIPAIDIINGKCVRLSKGDYSKPYSPSYYMDVVLEGKRLKNE